MRRRPAEESYWKRPPGPRRSTRSLHRDPPHRGRHSAVELPDVSLTRRLPSMSQWEADAPGIMRLPSGRHVRGRGLRRPWPEGVLPDLGVYLLGRRPAPEPWESRWVRWGDFRLPHDPAALREV